MVVKRPQLRLRLQPLLHRSVQHLLNIERRHPRILEPLPQMFTTLHKTVIERKNTHVLRTQDLAHIATNTPYLMLIGKDRRRVRGVPVSPHLLTQFLRPCRKMARLERQQVTTVHL
jgi:hypothetical protein